MRELAERMGTDAYLIDSAEDIQKPWLKGKKSIGVTAGASAPEVLVQQVVDGLKQMGMSDVVEVSGILETISFSMPKELREGDG